jgi:hypothetical protein
MTFLVRRADFLNSTSAASILKSWGFFEGVQMAWLRLGLAILIALFGSTAYAGPQAVPRAYQAGFYLEGCKDFLAGRSNFLSGRCVGAVEVLDELGSDNNLLCPPERPTGLSGCASLLLTLKLCPNE